MPRRLWSRLSLWGTMIWLLQPPTGSAWGAWSVVPQDTTHQQPADTTRVEIPSRMKELARDVGSRPHDVMDFLGIKSGQHVADILAAGGYYTYLVSKRVGSKGHVYAQGASPGLKARLREGDLKGATNITLVDSLSHLPSGTLDVVLLIRAYHLFKDPQAQLREVYRSLKPGGVVGVEEVRLDQPTGHNMQSHRMGEETVIQDFTQAGFELVEQSNLLRRSWDDYTSYRRGERHLTDRMLLKFRKTRQ